jgi:DNA sulfur modification protein DndB
MKVSFPAMRGTMGGRQYYATVFSLAEIPRLFKFTEWDQFTPELRAQRVLNVSRVPDIAKYMLDNEEGYLFSSITASYSTPPLFVPSGDSSDLGTLEMELDKTEFIINDGQHRCAAIATALKENPALGKDKISVLLFATENLERLQQMFSDLNRFAHKTSKSLDILYDHRDNLSALTMDVSEQVTVFRGMIDKERIAIPIRSPKLFTLATLYDANEELLGDKMPKRGSHDYGDRLRTAVEYWTEVASVVPDWKKAKDGEVKAAELRQEKINTHAVVVRALGGVGAALLHQHPRDWREKLTRLRDIDWRKSVGAKVNPLWDNVCITAGSVVSNRQARAQTLAVLKELTGTKAAGTHDEKEKKMAKRAAHGR